MQPKLHQLSIQRISFLKRAGYALLAVGLIFLTFLTTVPELSVPKVAVYSYVLLGVGFLVVLISKGFEIIQQLQLRRVGALCLRCGWYGSGRDWSQYQCCPECDSEDVVLQ